MTEGLGLENVGVKMTPRGQVEIDDHFATNVPGIFAIGDVIDGAFVVWWLLLLFFLVRWLFEFCCMVVVFWWLLLL